MASKGPVEPVNERRAVSVEGRAWFIVVVGLLPFWAFLVFWGWAFLVMSPDTAMMLLWFLLPVIPASAVTLLLAVATAGLYARTAGARGRRLLVAGGFFGAVVLAFGLGGWMLWQKQQRMTLTKMQEKERVVQLVGTSAEARAAVGEPSSVSISSSYETEYTMPEAYVVSVEGRRHVYAIVAAQGPLERRSLRLRCLTPKPAERGDLCAPSPVP